MRALGALVLLAAFLASLLVAAVPADAQQTKRILLYTGTTGYRHADAIDQGRPVVQNALQQAGYTVDWVDCDNNGGGANNCDNPAKNPAVFTDANLARYDAILLFNASAAWSGGGRPGPLWNADQRAAIIRFVQQGGGIAANHNATDMAAGVVSWDWWDGGPNSAVGTLMKGHAATNQNNLATVEVADKHHLSTRELPDTYQFGDEHYNFARSVRGTHHVLATLDERTYAEVNPMGQDHPITWCKLYDGAAVEDGTGTPKPYTDGRVWVSGMGHFGSSYTANGGNNELVKQIVGGVRWAAGEGKKSDCSGTVWSSFKRTILVSDAKGPMGIDIAPDGKVYWTEIGADPSYPDYESEGYIKMHDPTGAGNNKTTVATIPTRADHGNSEDGVLGMTLENGFDLSDPTKRDVYVYYSPRPGPGDNWPTTGDAQTVGYNQISRFTLNAEGTAVVPNSERVILRVPKVKIAGSPAGFQGGPTDSGPGHVGGAGLDFDSEGNLYLGVGDDVSPNASGHGQYVPLDYRARERWDARKTSANSNDLRGKVLRIRPLDDIPAGTNPDLNATYTVPAGNMFAPNTPNTRPEIYAMGFRQPFTVQADPENPGTVVVGEYCHDASANNDTRAPAGVCEWNIVDKPAFHGWPFCMGNNSPENSAFRWNYAPPGSTTGERYNCNQQQIPSDLTWAPAGQTNPGPTFPGMENIPGPAQPATVWKKDNAANGPDPLAFGNLSAGGRSPVTGPVYRYNAETAKPGAFPPYYDGSWFIANRGDSNGWWKEVRLREDNDQMLRVNDWAPAGQFGAPNTNPVIPSRFGPDGALYLARWHNGCCRNGIATAPNHEIMKVEFAVADECLEDTQAPNTNHAVSGREQPGEQGKYLESATLTLTAGDAGCAGLKSIEYRIGGTGDWQRYLDPLVFDEPGTYSVEYRATDTKDNVAAPKTAAFTVVELNDQVAPTVAGTVSGEQSPEGYYFSPATVSITAEDELSFITSIEYRVNQEGNWVEAEFPGDELEETLSREFAEPGFTYVEFRATDKSGNVSEPQAVSFSVVNRCTYQRSDEFDAGLDARWLRHTRNGGTPTEGVMAPTVSNGQLHMKTNDFEIDAASATTSVGPINFLAQDLPALGNAWTVETQFTVTHTGGWQHVGLMLWNGDNNFFRSTITHSLSAGNIYIEQSKDNPTTAEGARSQAGSNITASPTKQPITIRMRYQRAAGSDIVTPQFRIMAPANLADADWRNFGGPANFLDLNPAGGPRRDAAGSRIGIIAGGNFPGTTGSHPYNGTPATVAVDYFRVTPDTVVNCPDDDVLPPDVEALLDPDEPGPGGTYNGPVTVNIGAEDADSTVSEIEYSVDGGAWQDQAGAQASVRITREGDHTVLYRAVDSEGNRSAPKSISFTIADVRDVFAMGTLWEPTELSVDFADTVTWHFPEETAQFPHDVWLAPPGESAAPTGGKLVQVSGAVQPGGPSVDYTFRKAGDWTFICRLHATWNAQSSQWSGMIGKVTVGEDPNPGGGDPGPGPGGNPPPPPPPPPPGPPPVVVDPPFPSVTAASFGKLPKVNLARFLKRGVRITSACESGLSGKVTLKVSGKQARKAGLKKKAITLASKSVRCGSNDRVAVTLKASTKVRKSLKKAKRSLTASLKITMGSGAAATTDTARLVLKR